jgi:putative tricarboxylic transport membrane protein
MHRVKDANQAMTGIFLVLVALLGFYLLAPLSSDTEVGLGPGYVPRMLAFLQFALGSIMIILAFLQVGDRVEPWRLRPLALILGAIAFFAVTVERLGLVVALTGLVLIACMANRDTKFYEAIALAIGCVVFSVLVFVTALGLTIPVWPPISWGQ